jgi:hypothetical protein
LASSSLVYAGGDGNLLYAPDARGNRLPDFSTVGYQTGVVPLPGTDGGVVVPVQVALSPTAGDQTAPIQAAINQVSAMPLDANGFRGAVLLRAGEYPISGQLRIQASGVVLEGESSDPATGTRLRATGTTQRLLIQVTGSGSRATVSGTTHNLTDNYVPVGANSFTLDSAANLHVGDTVIVHRPSPANWIHAIGMDLLTNPWQPNSKNLDFDRVITNIDGNVVTVDAPLTNAFEQLYGGGTIYRYTWAGRLENVGLADFYAVSDSTSSTDQNHATGALQLDKVENAWAHDVIASGFAQNVYVVGGGVKWLTLDTLESLDTSVTSGAPPSGFLLGGQLTLVQNSYVHNGYHAFAYGAQVPGPNVVVNSYADGRGAEAGPHQRWSTGGLFDNDTILGTQLDIRNALNEGSGHGWQGANYVIWNSVTDNSLRVYSPPTAQNWVIGSSAHTRQGNAIFDSYGTTVDTPVSLYYEQLAERLANGGADHREYRLGDDDNFHPGDPADSVYVDPGWLAAVQAAAGSTAVVGFDDLRSAHKWVPFTFQYTLAPGEQVVGASLSLSLRGTGSVTDDDRLYLGDLGTSYRFDELGWTGLPRTGASPHVLDLSGFLYLLQGGPLNVAIQDDTAIDWAVLDIQVAAAPPRAQAARAAPPPGEALVPAAGPAVAAPQPAPVAPPPRLLPGHAPDGVEALGARAAGRPGRGPLTAADQVFADPW